MQVRGLRAALNAQKKYRFKVRLIAAYLRVPGRLRRVVQEPEGAVDHLVVGGGKLQLVMPVSVCRLTLVQE